MKRIFSLMQTALILSGMAFIACTTDSNSDEESNTPLSSLSDLPTKVYLASMQPFTGSANVKIAFSESDEASAGTIQNGQITLNLPEVASNYLESFSPCDDYPKGSCQTNWEIPSSVPSYAPESLIGTIPGISSCALTLAAPESYLERETIEGAFFVYFSNSGKLKGTATANLGSYYEKQIIDWNFSKGWNVIYMSIFEDESGNDQTTLSTDKSIIKGELKWFACAG